MDFGEYMSILAARRQEQMGHGQGSIGQTAGATDAQAGKAGEMFGGGGGGEEKRFGPWADMPRFQQKKGGFF